jgi:hypothetical protein
LVEGTRASALRHARLCYDHLAGGLGAGLAGRLLELDWVRHAPPASRAVLLTDAGRRGLAATFGLSLDDAPPRVRAGGATASRSRSE